MIIMMMAIIMIMMMMIMMIMIICGIYIALNLAKQQIEVLKWKAEIRFFFDFFLFSFILLYRG